MKLLEIKRLISLPYDVEFSSKGLTRFTHVFKSGTNVSVTKQFRAGTGLILTLSHETKLGKFEATLVFDSEQEAKNEGFNV